LHTLHTAAFTLISGHVANSFPKISTFGFFKSQSLQHGDNQAHTKKKHESLREVAQNPKASIESALKPTFRIILLQKWCRARHTHQLRLVPQPDSVQLGTSEPAMPRA
jgi:hypothetical protein